MAEHQNKIPDYVNSTVEEVTDSKDRGLFGLGGKKEEEEKKVSEPEPESEPQVHAEEEKEHSLLNSLHKPDHNSTESYDKKETDGEEKEGIVAMIKKKIEGDNKSEEETPVHVPEEKCEEHHVLHDEPTDEQKGFLEELKETISKEKCEDESEVVIAQAEPDTDEKKDDGPLDKIKEKLPGLGSNEDNEYTSRSPPPVEADESTEKKGIVEKIKEKLPEHGQKENNGEYVSHSPPLEQVSDKKGVVEKIKEKLPGHEDHNKEDCEYESRSTPPVEADEVTEKKGALEKIKEKLPGHEEQKEDKSELKLSTPPQQLQDQVECVKPEGEAEEKEKKGIIEKIKEKFPGYHPKTATEEIKN